MKKKKHLVIFDIDGTLTDSVKIHQDAFKEGLNLIGVKEFNGKFGTYKHHTDYHIAKVIYETATNEEFNDEKQGCFEENLYQIISKHRIDEISGAKSFIELLENETDFGVCYATGSLKRPAKYKLDKINVIYNTDLLIASNNLEEREKLIEKAIENSLKHYNIDKFDRIISFGDGIWDLLAAQNLNIEFIGIGKTNYEIMTQKGMTRHYNNFTEINTNEFN